MNLKEELINKIELIEDESLLKELHLILDTELQAEKEYPLTKAEIAAVEEGMADYKAGRTYGNNEATEKLKRWLKK